MTLFVVGSALTVAVFFLALWLLPEQPLSLFISRDFQGFSDLSGQIRHHALKLLSFSVCCRYTRNSSHKQTEKSLRFSVCFFF